ncbi:hypothetical protein SSX86_022227 [Deinandra increscens subsp. villosa]|uniref:CRIB domain-containing protein n=1 Tax=Deinandra increscens subsp. villosa TaxID=3103831 RepID=A0AAP0CNG9_9ASTR
MNAHKVKGLLKGLRYISLVFEEEKKQEIQIGGPTDVKHVAHYGCDGPAQESPSWMSGFGTSAPGQSTPSNASESPSDGPEWVSEGSNIHPFNLVINSKHVADTGQKMSRRERQEKPKSKHRRHRSVESSPDPDSQTKPRQPRRHHTRAEGRRAQDESLPEVPKRNRKKKPMDEANS